MLGVLHTISRDASRPSVQCSKTQSGGASYLILRSLDSGPHQLKTGLMIPTFRPKEDKLEVSVATSGGSPTSTKYDTAFKLSPATLSEQPPNFGTSEDSQPWKVNLSYGSSSFWFPWEEYRLNINLDLKRSGRDIPLGLTVFNQLDQFVIDRCITGYSFEQATPDPNSFTLVLKRHLFLKWTAVIIFVMAVAFLIYLAKIAESKALLTNSLGYLIVLWGVRGIIVGPTTLFPTLVDFFTLTAYVAVAAILLDRWLFHRDIASENPPLS